MLIEEIMKKNVVTASPEDSLATALRISKENRIRHLPVVENQVLVGMISDRDLRDVCPSRLVNEDQDDLLQRTKLKDIMITNVITAHPLDFVEDAASVIYEFRIGCLPVIQKGKLVGIVTETDILHTLVELMGVNQPSSHIEVDVTDKPGMLAEVALIFKNLNINVTSVYLKPSKKTGQKTLVFRVQTMDPRRICTAIEKAGYTVKGPLGLSMDGLCNER
ncbi:acetoin utilization protein AcuB [Desulfuribacillus stibiiarsenatis]|uniref:Acetoin utilization protein AcuB n=1 Tax=Desulfuribacillus stibiiarsenatis TaxID=1390249 RepID=A0A1E5LA10_9FIRM|nr:acetoin utilization AcuB family protein [Desulfuribacillus stibiiarsenatis]OEH86965.1 acetoin utilization protein AcuB [Desulfuribacillus stibiiarsenatis]